MRNIFPALVIFLLYLMYAFKFYCFCFPLCSFLFFAVHNFLYNISLCTTTCNPDTILAEANSLDQFKKVALTWIHISHRWTRVICLYSFRSHNSCCLSASAYFTSWIVTYWAILPYSDNSRGSVSWFYVMLPLCGSGEGGISTWSWML